MVHKNSTHEFKKDSKYINGLADYHLQLREHIKVYDSDMVELRDIEDKHMQELDFVNFPPGSIIAFKWDFTTSSHIYLMGHCHKLVRLVIIIISISGSPLILQQRLLFWLFVTVCLSLVTACTRTVVGTCSTSVLMTWRTSSQDSPLLISIVSCTDVMLRKRMMAKVPEATIYQHMEIYHIVVCKVISKCHFHTVEHVHIRYTLL